MTNIKNYKDLIIELIDNVEKNEQENIVKSSQIMFEAMKNGLVVHTFATGHSHMFCEELFYRAGGLVQINPILSPFLMQHEGAVRSTKFERLQGVSKIIYDSLDLKENEPFIIVSNSGINAVPIEMAKICKENGHKVIVITSKKQSQKLTSRYENYHLYDFADVVIDNHTPSGDGLIESSYGKIGAASTITNSFIAQKLVLEIVNRYEEENLTPPIYISANTKYGDEHNKELIKKYKDRIKPLY